MKTTTITGTFCKGIKGAVILAVLCILPMNSEADNILIYHTDNHLINPVFDEVTHTFSFTPSVEIFRHNLLNTGVFTSDDSITITNMDDLFAVLEDNVEPASDYLQQFDCIYVYTIFRPDNPELQGDLLKDYAYYGGRVILLPFALSVLPSDPDTPLFELKGGIMGEKYNPLQLTAEIQLDIDNVAYNWLYAKFLYFNSSNPLTLPDHPLLEDVMVEYGDDNFLDILDTPVDLINEDNQNFLNVLDSNYFVFFGNDDHAKVTVAPGATLVGSDMQEQPLIAVN